MVLLFASCSSSGESSPCDRLGPAELGFTPTARTGEVTARSPVNAEQTWITCTYSRASTAGGIEVVFATHSTADEAETRFAFQQQSQEPVATDTGAFAYIDTGRVHAVAVEGSTIVSVSADESTSDADRLLAMARSAADRSR